MKSYRPTTQSRRHMTGIDWPKLLTTNDPKKSLTHGLNRKAGHNSAGRVTMNYQGGGHKRMFRDIDLVCYRDGARRYVLLPQGVKVNDTIMTSEKADIKAGNRLPLKAIPVGAFVYNVELTPNGGSKIARSAGNYVQVVAQDAGYTHLKML